MVLASTVKDKLKKIKINKITNLRSRRFEDKQEIFYKFNKKLRELIKT